MLVGISVAFQQLLAIKKLNSFSFTFFHTMSQVFALFQPSSLIFLVTQELMSSGRNPIAIQNASEAALQLGKIPLALDMFTRMQQLGMALRPHFFWPVLIQNSKTYGEKGEK